VQFYCLDGIPVERAGALLVDKAARLVASNYNPEISPELSATVIY